MSLKNNLAGLIGFKPLPPLTKDFIFGVATADHQCEAYRADSGLGDFSHAPVWPRALYSYLGYLAGLFPEKPIIILENGCVDQADILESPVARASYLKQHIREVQRAVRDGANVTMYLYWAITTNREWGHPFGPEMDYGLYHIRLNAEKQDYDFQKRVPKDCETIYAYSKIISECGVV